MSASELTIGFDADDTLWHNEVYFERVHERCSGGYAVVAMISGVGIVAFRDPYGIRPLVYGHRDTDQGREYMIASESVAIDTLGFELVRDVAPGEAVVVNEKFGVRLTDIISTKERVEQLK